ncbi:5'-nucleotidase, lipoprotein e(P4) family [Salinisphaera orenii]|uniref:5'-nucleotidase, lipoprotein e(P4) family n=1 Tax=Salinisphaera orenii TaxID=856731 RepID=UPI003A4C5D4D
MGFSRNTLLAAALCAGIAPVASAASNEATDGKSICAQAAWTMGLRYQQRSAEVAALQRQSFNLATLRLKQAISEHDEDANLAIITDLDETVIDNTALLARDMQACHDYTSWDTWTHWERDGKPRLIPGAADFLKFADAQGVDIFYISNRTQGNEADTIASLEALELPQVSKESVMLLGPPKTERRAQVVDSHTLVMQIGDSLHDFSDKFGDADLEERHRLVEKNTDRFGDEWIVLPNSAYGGWSDAELNAWEAPLKAE